MRLLRLTLNNPLRRGEKEERGAGVFLCVFYAPTMLEICAAVLRWLGLLLSACGGHGAQQQPRSQVVSLVRVLPRVLVTARRQQEREKSQQQRVVVFAVGPLCTARAVEVEQFVLDPITRGLLRRDEAVRIGKTLYDARSLSLYLSNEGNEALCPVSRVRLSQEELALVACKARSLGLSAGGPDRFDEQAVARSRRKSDADEVMSLESMLGEIVVEIQSLIEIDQTNVMQPLWAAAPFGSFMDDASPPAELSLSLLMSQFTEHFARLKAISLEQSYFALCSYRSFLSGPPRRPGKDGRERVLSLSLSSLGSLWTAQDQLELEKLRS